VTASTCVTAARSPLVVAVIPLSIEQLGAGVGELEKLQFQVRLVETPWVTVEGVVVNESMTGATGAGVTATVVPAVSLPASFVQVSVKVEVAASETQVL
jgi:hypothetical protein